MAMERIKQYVRGNQDSFLAGYIHAKLSVENKNT